MSDIKPNSQVTIKVVKNPTNQAARKTIQRLLSKDGTVKAENRRLKRVRKTHFYQARRGGRFWNVNVVKQNAVLGVVGETGVISASLDVITDLKSVANFLEITPA
jgi:hypothetical protein